MRAVNRVAVVARGALAVATVLAAGGRAARAGDEPRADFAFANGAEPKTLDPQQATGQIEGRVLDAMFEGLTRRDAKTLRAVSGQAESWDVSDDGKRWEFHLRADAKWSNGDPVTARDFVRGWVRLQEPETASEYAYLFRVVKHAEAFNTYRASVAALRGDPAADDPAGREGLARGVEALLAANPGGVEAGAWRRFLGRRGAEDALAGSADPRIAAGLGVATGSLSPEAGASFLAGLRAEGERRGTALDAARAHFGVDEGVFATDDKTFVVELNAFAPYFLELTSSWPAYPMNAKTVRPPREDPASAPARIVTNGAFLLKEWTPKTRVRLAKNPAYWGAKDVALETVDVLPIEDRAMAYAMFLSGDVDWAPSGFPADRIDEARRRSTYYGTPGMVVYYFKVNCTRKPFDDPRIRRALAKSVDRRTIVEQIARGGQVPATSIVAPGLAGYRSPENDLAWSPEEARRLLAEAGFVGGKGFPALSIAYNTDEGHRKIAAFVSSTWTKELGLHVTEQNADWQSMLERVRALDYDVVRAGWIGDYRDPKTFLEMWVTGGPNNQTGWSDASYDRLLSLSDDPLGVAALPAEIREGLLARLVDRPAVEHAMSAVTAKRGAERLAAAASLRMLLLREAEAILAREVPLIPVYDYVASGLVQPWVEGFFTEARAEDGSLLPNVEDLHPLRDIRTHRPPR